MYSNLAMLPSTNLAQLLGLLNPPLLDTYSLFDPTPQIQPLPSQSLIEIPPLLTQPQVEKRQNMSDLGNPIKKRVKYNPEVSIHTPQVSMLGAHLMFDNIFPLENSMFEDQDAVIFNYHNLRNIQAMENPYITETLADFQRYRYEEDQLQNLRNLLNQDTLYQRKNAVRSCDLSELVIPPLSSSIPSRKSIQKEDEISNKIQYAIQDLQQKLGLPQHIEIDNRPVKSVSPSLTIENHGSLLNSRQLNQEQFNINNLAKNKSAEFKLEKINWNESPNLTGAETNGSCSTSDIWESVSQSDTKYEDDTNSTTPIVTRKPQKKQRTSNFERQLACEEKMVQGKSLSLVEIIEAKKNGRKVKKVKVEIETVKEEVQKSEKSKGRIKLDPLFVSKWEMTSERRRNRWQGTKQTSLSKPDDSRKASKLNDDEEEDIEETPVGKEYQAEITEFCEKSESDKGRRCPKLKWDPSTVKVNKLADYFKKLEDVLECDVNQEKALSLLVKNEHDPKKVYEHIEGRENVYIKEFKIRPKRIPGVPLFGDFRVLY